MADEPVVLITGAAGDIGSRLVKALSRGYRAVGLDRPGKQADVPLLGVDLSDQVSIEQALAEFSERWGTRVASARRARCWWTCGPAACT